jgi:regulator of protease activity HflC (stomatin/prohibitin superfamily)
VVPGSEFQAFYKLTNPQSQITAYIFDVVRSCVPKILLDDVFSVRRPTARPPSRLVALSALPLLQLGVGSLA